MWFHVALLKKAGTSSAYATLMQLLVGFGLWVVVDLVDAPLTNIRLSLHPSRTPQRIPPFDATTRWTMTVRPHKSSLLELEPQTQTSACFLAL